LEYTITPMLVVLWEIPAALPRTGINLGLHGFELYSEMEYLFDLQSSDGISFITGLIFLFAARLAMVWISAQQTKMHKSDLEPEWGFLLVADTGGSV